MPIKAKLCLFMTVLLAGIMGLGRPELACALESPVEEDVTELGEINLFESGEAPELASESEPPEPLTDQPALESSVDEQPAEEQITKQQPAAMTEADATPSEPAMVSDKVELNGDVVEYSMDGNKVIAKGNVIVINKDMKLMCDRIEFSRDTNLAHATGHIRLIMSKGDASEMTGEKLTFDFNTMQGNFDGAHIYAEPYFGYGDKVAKVGENHMVMEKSYITTCDLDKPHFRMKSKKMDVYPGDKLIARHIRMLIGKVPLLYIPRFTQDLRDKEPIVTFTPGFDKDWGAFLLSNWRYYLNDNFKGIIHLDAREKKDIAWGIDLDYKTPNTGKGQIRTYYMNERSITSDRFWQERPSPTIERERFGVEWRHKWNIDNSTNAILQYSKQSDADFLKDYFKRNHDEDASPDTFFLLTKGLPLGLLSFRTDARVNRFESAVEHLPEVQYDLSNAEIGNSGFYFRNKTTYSNLTSKTASPSEARTNTMRADTLNELSYPMKVGFIEFRPYVGGRNTYYSKTKDPDEYGSIRGIFNTGANLSTKIFKVFDVDTDKFGLNIHRLRHIITPSVNYQFSSKPTRTSDQLDYFDAIDSLDIVHNVNLSLENKLQTKRNDETVELLRAVIGTDFHLKENPGKGGFDQISTDIDFNPTHWLTFYFDSKFDTLREHLSTANFDMYINGGEKWSLDISKRWNRDVDDQLTTAFNYRFNQKWALRTYTRFDLDGGVLKEQEYALERDLHEWTMDINFNETRTQGNEIWIVFTLKAFPDMVIDFGTSYNKRKAGSHK